MKITQDGETVKIEDVMVVEFEGELYAMIPEVVWGELGWAIDTIKHIDKLDS